MEITEDAQTAGVGALDAVDKIYQEVTRANSAIPASQEQRFAADPFYAQAMSRKKLLLERSGAESPRVQEELMSAAVARVTATDTSLIGAAWDTTTAAAGLLAEADRWLSYPKDDTFKVTEHINELTEGMPAEYAEKFLSATSMPEAISIRQQILKSQDTMLRLQSEGWAGTGAALVAGVMDLDAPLTFLTVGTGAAAKLGITAAKLSVAAGATGKVATRIAGAAYKASEGAVTGAVMGGLVGGISAATQPTLDSAYAVQSTLGGMLFGGTIGGAIGARMKANSALREGIETYAKVYKDPMLREYFQNTTAGKEFSDLAEEWADAGTAVKTGARGTLSDSPWLTKMQELIDKSPLSTDAHILWNSTSPEAHLLAFSMFESAPGTYRNSKSASLLKTMYYSEAAEPLIAGYHEAYYEWAASNGAGKIRAYAFDNELRDNFNWEVAQEMNRRELGKSPVNVHPAVKRYCDAADKGTDIIRRRAQETGVDGFTNVQQKSGYMPRLLSGKKYMQAAMKAINGEQSVKELLVKAMRAANPELSNSMAKTMADAFFSRARGKSHDMDMQVLNLVSSDSRAFIRETLENNNVHQDKIDGILSVLMENVDEKGTVSYSKRRTALDLDTAHDNISMRDLIDYDVPAVYGNYAQAMAGRSAAAAKGITSTTKLNQILDAIMAKDPTIGSSKLGLNVQGKDFLRAIMTPFFGGAEEAHILPIVRRMTQLTTLGTMGMLGIPQLAEAGAQIATVGMWNWIKELPEVLKGLRGNAEHKRALAEELRGLTGQLGREWALYRPDLNLEFGRYNLDDAMKISEQADRLLAKGLQVQAHLSLFNTVKQIETETLLISYTDKLMRSLRDNSFSDDEVRRLMDMGFDPAFLAKIKSKYIDTGKVTFTAGGTCDTMGLASWNAKDAEQFNINMRRMTSQVIQKGEAGEGWLWGRTNIGKLFTQFKSFPMLAVQKQVLRNLALGDAVAYNTALFGLVTAALAYSTREVLNGKTENLSPEKLFKGAIGMSNLTGWLPMFTDPVASMLGMNDLMFNDFTRPGQASILSVPALSVLPRQARIPGSILGALPGVEFGKDDAYALKAAPIIGSMWGVRRAIDMAAE